MSTVAFTPSLIGEWVRDRRGAPSPPVDSNLKQLNDTLPQLVDAASIISEQLERLASTNERVAESKIRKNNAIADFIEGLETLLKEGPHRPASSDQPRATASYASGTHYTKDDILSIINNMRDQGATFAIIADYLREKGIPTFSGRGEWHAQTIHRLCK
jgi:hypothetical protein